MSSNSLFLLYTPITMLLPALLTWYVGYRLVSGLKNTWQRRSLWLVALLPFGFLASLALIFWGEQDRAPLAWLLEPGFFFLGYLLTTAPILLVVDGLFGAADSVNRVSIALRRKANRVVAATSQTPRIINGHPTSTPEKREPQPRQHRLKRSIRWLALFVGLLLCLLGRQVAARAPVLTQVTVPVRHLGQPFEGYRILQLTDLHLRVRGDAARLRSLVAQANATKPDLIAITGDVVDGPIDNLRALIQPLGELRAKDGVWLVLGNHEYYADADACVTEFRRLGLTVLLDEHRVIEHRGALLTVAGVTNPQHGMHGSKLVMRPSKLASMSADPEVALRNAPAQSPKILLAHQPKSVALARSLGVALALCGHSHGGGFFPWSLLVPLAMPYSSGLYHDRGMAVFVGRGTGTFGPKLRLGASPEIALITLSATR